MVYGSNMKQVYIKTSTTVVRHFNSWKLEMSKHILNCFIIIDLLILKDSILFIYFQVGFRVLQTLQAV